MGGHKTNKKAVRSKVVGGDAFIQKGKQMTTDVIYYLDTITSDLSILKGLPGSVGMRSGLVVLSPKDSVGKHNTEDFEELIIVLNGKGEMLITGQDPIKICSGVAVYCPPKTEHDVTNTGTDLLRYIYVVVKVVD